MNARAFAQAHPRLVKIVSWVVNRLPFNNSISLRGNKLRGGLLTRCRIRVLGKNNEIVIGDGTWLQGAKLTIRGSNCRIYIGNRCALRGADLYLEDDGCAIDIGDETTIYGNTHLACIEGKTIRIGENCLFSSWVTIRVGDSHSILDETDNRINPSADVIIGDRVWAGNQTTILKGSVIPNDSVIATGAVVTKAFTQPGIILGGVPARIIKQNVHWDKKRI